MADGEIDNSIICALLSIINEYRIKIRRRQQASLINSLKRINLMLKRRRQKNFALVCMINLFASQPEITRRFWVQPTKDIGLFWERTVQLWTDQRLWLENFRMSKGTFNFVCQELFPYLCRQDTNCRKAIRVEKRVAICVWHLATVEDLRSLGWRFGVGKSTACQIINEVCQTIVDVLLPQIITWPTGETLCATVDGFLSTWGFPQCAGAVDGTHIPIVAPSESSANYYNRKGFYSVILQAVVDDKYRFTDIYIKWPGKVHDARVFANSGLYAKGQAGMLFPDVTENINGCDVPIMLIGDSAYPLLPWLMRRFHDNGNLNRHQVTFNYRQSRARMVVECALGRMKSRFRCLQKRSETSLNYLPCKVATCCVLHNMCEMRKDVIQEDEVEGFVDANENYIVALQDDANAEEFRNALTEFFVTK